MDQLSSLRRLETRHAWPTVHNTARIPFVKTRGLLLLPLQADLKTDRDATQLIAIQVMKRSELMCARF